MNVRDIKLGAKLELMLADNSDSIYTNTYVSQLLDILDDNNIMIASPIIASRFAYIPADSSITLIFHQPGDGLMSCTGKILGHSLIGNVHQLKVNINNDFVKVQRRSFFRLDCNLDVKYRIAANGPGENKHKYKKAISKNISGSGMLITTKEKIEPDTQLEILLTLDFITVVKAVCVVIRSNMVTGNKESNYETGLHFIDISEKDRNTIVKYIFKKQRILLKNKKL